MKRKDGHKRKSGGEKLRYLKIPSSSLNDKTRRQGEDFPGHRSQARSSPSKNFGDPRKKGTFWNK